MLRPCSKVVMRLQRRTAQPSETGFLRWRVQHPHNCRAACTRIRAGMEGGTSGLRRLKLRGDCGAIASYKLGIGNAKHRKILGACWDTGKGGAISEQVSIFNGFNSNALCSILSLYP